jgi:hypothetical protein
VILSVICLLVRCVLGCLMVRARREVSKDAELLVLRAGAENPVMAADLGSWGRPSRSSGCASTSRSGTVNTRDTTIRLFSGAPRV